MDRATTFSDFWRVRDSGICRDIAVGYRALRSSNQDACTACRDLGSPEGTWRLGGPALGDAFLAFAYVIHL